MIGGAALGHHPAARGITESKSLVSVIRIERRYNGPEENTQCY